MKVSKYIFSGLIGSGIFCSIFSMQWFLLNTKPVLIAYFPPFLVGFVSGIVIYFLKTRWESEAASKEREKMKAITEITGAVCHETNQPLQVIIGNLELFLLDLEKESDSYNQIVKIHNEVERIAEITQKLQNINQYKTKKYLSGKIIDIDASSN